MKTLKNNQDGLIPLLIVLFLLLVGAIVFVYIRVANAN